MCIGASEGPQHPGAGAHMGNELCYALAAQLRTPLVQHHDAVLHAAPQQCSVLRGMSWVT